MGIILTTEITDKLHDHQIDKIEILVRDAVFVQHTIQLRDMIFSLLRKCSKRMAPPSLERLPPLKLILANCGVCSNM